MQSIKQMPKQNRLRRRDFVVGGVAGTAALLAGSSAARAAVDTTGWKSYTSAGPDGARVKYPQDWTLDACTDRESSLDRNLLYPHQAFAIRTAATKPPYDSGPRGDGLPELTGYPANAGIVWLMYYDEVVEGAQFSGATLGGLQGLPSEFPQFESYLGRFSNAARSFLLKVWVGTGVSTDTRAGIGAVIQSISVP